MKITLLAKQVPDTWSERKLDLSTGMLDRSSSEQVTDEINERALEVALQYKDAHPDTIITIVTMGNGDAEKIQRKLLSMGADQAILVCDPGLAGSDMVQTAKVLAAAIRPTSPDLVIAGNESTDGRGGVVPSMVAELLDLPILPGLDEIEMSTDQVSGTAQIDGGTLHLRASLPAVISVTEKTAEARFPNFKGIMQAKKKPLQIQSPSDLGLAAGPNVGPARSVMVSAEARAPKEAGPKVVDDGSAASQLVAFLAKQRLI